MRVFKSSLTSTTYFGISIMLWSVFVINAHAADNIALSNKIVSEDAISIQQRVVRGENVSVIVRLKTRPAVSNQRLESTPLGVSRHAIKQAQTSLLNDLNLPTDAQVQTFNTIPFIAITVDRDNLQALSEHASVEAIQINRLNKTSLAESIPFIEADTLWEAGQTGVNQAVAIIDTGVDTNHDFFAGKVVSEACYSSSSGNGVITSVCPQQSTSYTGPDAGLHCSGPSGCNHGTHVAGIAVGNGQNSGVAKDSQLIPIQVFSLFNSFDICGLANPCVLAFDSDVIAGLERVYELRNDFNIAAVNLSLGSDVFSSQAQCNQANSAYVAVVAQLRSAGIAVTSSAGNDSGNGVSSPACVSGISSVGSVDLNNNISGFSNRDGYMSFFAPGEAITSSVPNNGFATFQGTSMAAPHAAGAIALLKAAYPTATLEQVLSALESGGTPVDVGNNESVPSINIAEASSILESTVQPPGEPSGFVDITISTDNAEVVYFNGNELGSSNNWQIASQYTAQLQQGTNVLAVRANDVDGIAALIAQLDIDGLIEISSTNWRVSTQQQANWQDIDFDDTAWDYASSYGVYGAAPWARRVAGLANDSLAEWIWSSDYDGDNQVFFRFVFESDGSAPPPPPPEPEEPVITTSALADAQVDTPYSQVLVAIEGTPPFDWDIISGALPSGLSLSGNGTISGTSQSAGEAFFTARVIDAEGLSDSAALSINVLPAPVASSTVDIIVSTDNADTIYFNGNLIGSSNDWRSAGQYTADLIEGTNVLAIRANDVDGIAALIAELSLNGQIISSNADWRITTQEQDNWQSVTFDDSAWDFATSYGTYGVAPWGTRVNGLPNGSEAEWIWSEDNEGDNQVFFRYVIENGSVEPPPPPPPPPSQPVITTSVLEDGQVNLAYSALLEATDGTAPFSWGVISGSLPAGLELNENGEISGVPSVAGQAFFDVQVTDAQNQQDLASLAITILPEPQVATSMSIIVSTDNADTIYFNGELIGSSNNWQAAGQYTVALQEGTNVLAVRANDVDGVAALIAQLNRDGLIDTSGIHWRVSTIEQANWQAVGFDDSAWDFASSYGVYGVAPWNKRVSGLPSNSQAQWIWTTDNLDDNQVFFRLVIEN